MPAQHGRGLHDDHRATPREQLRQHGQARSGRGIYRCGRTPRSKNIASWRCRKRSSARTDPLERKSRTIHRKATSIRRTALLARMTIRSCCHSVRSGSAGGLHPSETQFLRSTGVVPAGANRTARRGCADANADHSEAGLPPRARIEHQPADSSSADAHIVTANPGSRCAGTPPSDGSTARPPARSARDPGAATAFAAAVVCGCGR